MRFNGLGLAPLVMLEYLNFRLVIPCFFTVEFKISYSVCCVFHMLQTTFKLHIADVSEMLHFQAFCLPIIQIVYETLKDIQEGKGSKGHTDGKSLSSSG